MGAITLSSIMAGGGGGVLSSVLLLAPAVGETEGAMDSASIRLFTSSFAYNFVRK